MSPASFLEPQCRSLRKPLHSIFASDLRALRDPKHHVSSEPDPPRPALKSQEESSLESFQPAPKIGDSEVSGRQAASGREEKGRREIK